MPNAMIDASIPLQAKVPTFFNAGDAMAMKRMQYQNQLTEMQMQEAQQRMGSQNAMRGALGQPGAFTPEGDISPEALQRLQQANPAAAIELRNQMLMNEERRAQIARAKAAEQESMQKLATERRQAFLTKVGPTMQTMVNQYDELTKKGVDPALAAQKVEEYKATQIDEMEKSGELSKQEADQARAAKFDPARFRTTLMMMKGASGGSGPTSEILRAKAAVAAGTMTQEEADAIIQKETGGGGQSSFAKEMKDAGIKPGSAEWNRNWQKRLARETSPTSTMINLAGAGEGGLAKDKETLRFMAEQYWAGDKSVLQNLGRGAQGSKNIMALRKEIAEVGKETGRKPKDLAMAMAEFAGITASERTLGTRQAQIELAANVVEQFVPIAIQASKDYKRSGIKSLNDLQKAVQSRTASPELRRLDASVNAVVNAYGRAINPTGVGNEADKREARKILDSAFANGDFEAAANQILVEIHAEQKAPGAVKGGMRKYFTGSEEPGKGKAKEPAEKDYSHLWGGKS